MKKQTQDYFEISKNITRQYADCLLKKRKLDHDVKQSIEKVETQLKMEMIMIKSNYRSIAAGLDERLNCLKSTIDQLVKTEKLYDERFLGVGACDIHTHRSQAV